MKLTDHIRFIYAAPENDPIKELIPTSKRLVGKVKRSVKSFFLKPEITLIRKHDNTQLPGAPSPIEFEHKKIPHISTLPTHPTEQTTSIPTNEFSYIFYDNSLEELRCFMRDFSKLFAEEFFETQIAGQLELFQSAAPSLPAGIKTFAKLIIEVGDKAAKPIFQKYKQQKARVIDPQLAKIFRTLLKSVDGTIDRKALYELMEKQISEELKDMKAPEKQDLVKDYIKPIINWLVRTEHTMPLEEVLGPGDSSKEETSDKVFEKAITFLVERKVDQYAHLLERTVENRLAEITKATISINAQIMTDFFSERLAELIYAMPFKETADSIVHDVLYWHFQAVDDAHKNVKDFISENTKKQSPHPESPRQVKTTDTTLRNVFLKSYGDHRICRMDVKQTIEQEIALTTQGNNPLPSRLINEKAIFTIIAENILDLMTPIKKKMMPNGTIEEVDPFIELWDRLYFPDELQEILKHISELTDEFVTPDTIALFKNIKDPTIEIVKNIFRSSAKEILKTHLVTFVQKGFEKVIDPQKFDELAADAFFPAINRKILQIFIELNVEKNLNKFTPLIHSLITAPTHQREEHLAKLRHELIQETKSKLKHSDPQYFYATESNEAIVNFGALQDNEWNTLADKCIVSLEMIFKKYQVNGVPFDPTHTKPDEIKAILTKAINEPYSDNDLIYGEIVNTLLFKTGGLPYESWISPLLKKSVSESITTSSKPMREDHQFVISVLAKTLKETVLKPEKIKELLSKEPPVQPKHTKERLAHQIKVTAHLAHDLIIRMSEDTGTITGAAAEFMVKRIFSDKQNIIEGLITNIYKKEFGERLILENLMMNVTAEIFRSFSMASESLRLYDNIRILTAAT